MERVKAEIVLAFGLILGIVISFEARAADMTPEERAYELEEIVVTATRTETPKEEVAANITVITRDDIEKMPVSNAAEVLQYIPGVYVEFNGGLGSQATATIQGSDVRHVAVYQDGVPLNQLANPLTDLSYLPIDTIERIEIYKGAASSAWGSSLGGVINIITKRPTEAPETVFDTEAGSLDTQRAQFLTRGMVGCAGYVISGSWLDCRGYDPVPANSEDRTEYTVPRNAKENMLRLRLAPDVGEGRLFVDSIIRADPMKRSGRLPRAGSINRVGSVLIRRLR